MEFRVQFPYAGSFFVQLEYLDLESHSLKYTPPQYINVEPLLSLPTNTNPIKTKQLSILTVLSRCLGPIDRWGEVLDHSASLKYNAIHFTPIQQYGISMSHYSLKDQTTISDYFFTNTDKNQQTPSSLTSSTSQNSESNHGSSSQLPDKAERLEMVAKKMKEINQKGLLSIVDIVLNHSACNSEWVFEHPEVGYDTSTNSRHLNSAYVLDQCLEDLSRDFANRANGVTHKCPHAPHLRNDHELDNLMSLMTERICALRLEEYFLFDKQRVAKEFMEALPGLKTEQIN